MIEILLNKGYTFEEAEEYLSFNKTHNGDIFVEMFGYSEETLSEAF